jgi:DNA polymerase III epsilon subunit-like protein
MIDLLRFKDKQKYIIFDFETCHLNLTPDFNNLPWQCTYLIAQGNKIVQENDRFPFWEPLPITKGAAAVTRFNYHTYKSKSEPPQKVLDHFNSFIYNPEYLIVGHNTLGFDTYVHSSFRQKCGLKVDYSYIPRMIDTNCLSKALLLGKKPNQGESLINFQYRMTSIIQKGLKTNVAAMCNHFQIEFDKEKAHDGLYDCKRTFDLFNKLIYQLDI